MPQFAPFSYGNVLAQSEGIRGARISNQMAQQQLDPMSTRNQLASAQLEGQQLTTKRGQMQFDDEQRLSNTKLLWQAASEVAENPQSAQKWFPILKEKGIGEFTYDPNNLPAIQQGAAKQRDMAANALKGPQGRPGTGPSAVQEYNFWSALDKQGKKDFIAIKRATPNAKFVDTGSTVQVFDPVTAQPIAEIQKGLAPEQEIDYIGEAAETRAARGILGKSRAEAEIDLPRVVDSAEYMTKQIDDLLAHPGLKSSVGATLKPGMKYIPGTDEKDFSRRLDQIKGGQFLQAFQMLKGGGQITEIEGKKATDAISRMDAAQSEKEFIAAANEFKWVVNKALARAKGKAGVGRIGKGEGKTIEDGYEYLGGPKDDPKSWKKL